jgi:hypothetical protein
MIQQFCIKLLVCFVFAVTLLLTQQFVFGYKNYRKEICSELLARLRKQWWSLVLDYNLEATRWSLQWKRSGCRLQSRMSEPEVQINLICFYVNGLARYEFVPPQQIKERSYRLVSTAASHSGVPGSNLYQETAILTLSWFSLVPPGKFQDSDFN